ncbi:MAG: AbrB/MazE/SpoVT family DNA-binding domain-containing protein [Methanobacteriota archaeon]|nr:MAG: AbrB/MazE/SpoVT family DNA-binding domain-containing protein [Euryarchaeota archaeon]
MCDLKCVPKRQANKSMVAHGHKVSNKGQIVVPAKYRKRLDIHPQDKMNFRIRGHFLIVEKARETTKNINYLREKKGKLGEEFLSPDELEDIIRDLLYQQFYRGNNYVTDRVGRSEYKVLGAQAILDEVVEVFKEGSEPWLHGDYVETLRHFAEDLDLDFPTLLEEFVKKMKNLEVMGPITDKDGASIVYALAIGETLSEFRTRVGDMVTENLIKEAEVVKSELENSEDPNIKVENYSAEELEDIITQKLADKYSILMNLRVLKELAKVSLKSIGQRQYKKISEELFKSIFLHEEPKEPPKATNFQIPSIPSFEPYE